MPSLPLLAQRQPLLDRSHKWRGVWSLYEKEVRRFLSVFGQTVAAPVVTTLLFLAVFTVAPGRGGTIIYGVPYAEFLAPGLAIMAMAQNAFANTSSSIVISKVQGNIVDLLLPPLSPGDIMIGMTGSGVTRGVLVGIVVGLAMWIFVPWHIAHPLFVLYHGLAGALMLSLLGIVGGIWSEKFDHIAAVTNFVVTPATFLSGSFYTLDRLPPLWQQVARLNPFFYMIDGFRYGFIGASDAPVGAGLAVMALVDAALALLAYQMIRSGYKLKA
jgi:ABC-2 type transport system permease protein